MCASALDGHAVLSQSRRYAAKADLYRILSENLQKRVYLCRYRGIKLDNVASFYLWQDRSSGHGPPQYKFSVAVSLKYLNLIASDTGALEAISKEAYRALLKCAILIC
jgi:hypothetical protein